MHKCVSGFVKSSIWSQLRRGRLSCPLLCWLKLHWKHNLKVGSFSWGICQMTKHKQDLAVSIHWSRKDSRGSMKLWNLFSLNNIWSGIFRFKLLQIFSGKQIKAAALQCQSHILSLFNWRRNAFTGGKVDAARVAFTVWEINLWISNRCSMFQQIAPVAKRSPGTWRSSDKTWKMLEYV